MLPYPRLTIAAVILLVAIASGYGWYRHRFPYGWSHCCDLGLHFALLEYAEKHNGWFPKGEATPEASLSLVYRQNPSWAYTLPGKTVPLPVVRETLEAGRLLSPDTCGWHYVEGLRKDDDRRLALFWDKAGLGHNGERLNGGGHIVLFVDGDRRHIPESQWPGFLEEQAGLLANLQRPR